MHEHRFVLQPYKGPATRHTCPQCERRRTFVRYVDIEGQISFPDFVGRCGREANCTYHYGPKQFFADYPNQRPDAQPTNRTSATPAYLTRPKPTPVMSFVDADTVTRSLAHYERNNLLTYLKRRIGPALTQEVATLYQIGTSDHWSKQGATVFWQRDEQGRVRGGKVMLYDPTTGKRRKEEQYTPTWVHRLLRLPDFTLTQCLFGLHQIATRPADVVAIVESEKTALIATVYHPHFVWLATGGLSNLTVDRCHVLKGRRVVLFPDLSTDGSVYAKWNQRAAELNASGDLQVRVSRLLEDKATHEQRAQGLDVADFLLRPTTYPAIAHPPTDWRDVFPVPHRWDAAGMLAWVRWMVLPSGVEEGTAADRAINPTKPQRSVVQTLDTWSTNPGSVLCPNPNQLTYL